MSVELPQAVGFEGLPDPLRVQALGMLRAGTSSRKVEAFLLGHGYRVSHNTLARHARASSNTGLQPSSAAVEPVQANNEIETSGYEQPGEVKPHGLVATDPFHARIINKYGRLDRVLEQAEKVSDFKAVAALDRADTQLMTLEADVTGRRQQATTNVSVQLVFGATQPQPRVDEGEIIDIQPVRER
ncbi:MAG TPA: hypothetical protein VEX68_05025 [Bryobacteraceae bacterium]|nr:hypothetical protein [Bryobacteraceae bacterium]